MLLRVLLIAYMGVAIKLVFMKFFSLFFKLVLTLTRTVAFELLVLHYYNATITDSHGDYK